MPKHDSKSVDVFGANNMRGLIVRNVGKPKASTDAMTWASPEYTTAERDLIPSPVNGMIIYNTTVSKHQGYNGSWNNLY
jgi:hypothetical protein